MSYAARLVTLIEQIPPENMPKDLILGTAGHIDHGKTALVLALTGINTDRLPAEKERGITIDLGFAPLELGGFHVGIVDVPGHERFVKNMLAGATGIDLALLVVAADDSIMPQTREHLAILELLRLKVGVIALTKCDLVEADWLDLVEEEVRELVDGTFLAEAPLVRTSATQGEGIEELRAALCKACDKVAQRPHDELFRLAIDRSFVVQGHGTVVTGSVNSGTASVGDALELQPLGREVRVRGLHNHDLAVEQVHRGQRAAMNLGGVHHSEIVRGQEVAAPGYLKASRVMTARLAVLPESPWPLKHRARVRCHVGTAELIASVALLDADVLKPGESGAAQFFLAEPCVAVWGQPLVVRSESPVLTIGGGQVLQPVARGLRRRQPQLLQRIDQLVSGDERARAAQAIYFLGTRNWSELDLCRDAGISRGQASKVVQQLFDEGNLVELPLGQRRAARMHADRLSDLCARIEKALARMHEEFPLLSMLSRQRLVSRFDYLGDDGLAQAVIDHLIAQGRIDGNDRELSLKGHGPKLSTSERKLLAEIIEAYQHGGFQPPDLAELQRQATARAAAVPELVELCVAQGQLVAIGGGIYLHRDWDEELRRRLRDQLTEGEGLSVSQIRDILGTTRKFAVPICEYLDRVGFTRREGDLRVLAGSS